MIGFTGGIGLARTNLVLIKGASVLGVRAGEAARKNPALGVARIKALDGVGGGWKDRPNISHRLPLEDYAKAMRLLIDRKAIGRVALMMQARNVSLRDALIAQCPESESVSWLRWSGLTLRCAPHPNDEISHLYSRSSHHGK